MEEMSFEKFKEKELCFEKYPCEWDFSLFKVKCAKCNSENVEVNGVAESEGGYYGAHSLRLRIWCKCHDCGNFMGVNGDNQELDEPFIKGGTE
jgi:hypothetical protein